MKSLFAKSFLAFISAFFLLILVLGAFIYGGFQQALTAWEKEKKDRIEAVITAALEKPETLDSTLIPANTPFILLNESKQLVFANRGPGFIRRLLSTAEMYFKPVEKNSRLLGYYYLGEIHFRDDTANINFLETLYPVMGVAFFASVFIAFLTAFLFSKSLARPAKIISQGLETITHGQLNYPIPEKGADELAQIARAVNTLRLQLAREHELRQQWAHDITHDLRTPIAALKAQLEGMQEGVLDLTPARIDKNLLEINRIEKLVNDLEELMRLEQPEIQINKREIPVTAFLEIVKNRFQHAIEEKNIQWDMTTHISSLWIDEDLMLRAVSNIMSNAIRHTNTDGQIHLLLENAPPATGQSPKTPFITLRIFNTGIPVPEHELRKVFDRLYRGEYARHTPGSGLGLTIAKCIVELHKGTISLQARPGEGTEVAVRLPALPE